MVSLPEELDNLELARPPSLLTACQVCDILLQLALSKSSSQLRSFEDLLKHPNLVYLSSLKSFLLPSFKNIELGLELLHKYLLRPIVSSKYPILKKLKA